MNPEQQRQPIEKQHKDKLFLALIAEKTCQHSKELCEEAADAQKRAQEMRPVSEPS